MTEKLERAIFFLFLICSFWARNFIFETRHHIICFHIYSHILIYFFIYIYLFIYIYIYIYIYIHIFSYIIFIYVSQHYAVDVLKTSWRLVFKMFGRHILKTSWRHYGKKRNTYWGHLYLTNLNVYLTYLYFTNLYLTILRRIQNALIRT